MHDNKRDGYNDDNEYIFANLSNAEGSNVNRIRFFQMDLKQQTLKS